MLKSLKQQESTDYKRYRMSIKEYVQCVIQALGLIGVFSYFFYRSYYAVIFMSPFIPFYIFRKKKQLGEKRRRNLMLQFKEMLVSVNGSVQAGYSLENSFYAAFEEMKGFYGEKSDIVRELGIIRRGLNNNAGLTGLIRDLANRSGIKDISDFAGVLYIGKQTGGNITRIMESYINVIDEKVAVMQEIDTLVSAKRFEQKIMNMVPFLIIFYIELTSPGFFSSLYHNAAGVTIMTVALVVYVFSVYMSEKIVDIRV